MFDKIIEFLKEMENKTLYNIIIVASMIYLLVKLWKIIKKSQISILFTLKCLLYHSFSIIFIIFIFIGIKSIFEISDKRSNESIELYNKAIELEITRGKYINTKLSERYNFFNGKYCKTMEAIISNPMHAPIEYITGIIYIYKDRRRLDRIKFETYNLNVRNSEVIFYDKMNDKIAEWNNFGVYINQIKINKRTWESITIQSGFTHRTHYMEYNLDKFYDYNIFGIKVKYNLAWLKEEIKMNIIPAIMFL